MWAGILNFSRLSLVVSCSRHVRILAGPAWCLAGFNYDHCQSRPPPPLLLSPSLRSGGCHFPTTIHRVIPPAHSPHHCLPRNDGGILWAITAWCLLCWLARCTCAVPVSRLRLLSPSSVTLVTPDSRASIYLEQWSTATQSARAGGGAHHIWRSYTSNVKGEGEWK